jgi:hypothetical protein
VPPWPNIRTVCPFNNMMYKTPTFAEPQQYNRPFSTGQLSAFIIQLVSWQVLPRSE